MDWFKKLFKGKEEVAGLDVGSSTIKIAQVARTQTGYALTRFAYCPTPPMTIKDGAIVDARVLGDTVRQLMTSNKITATKIVGAVSGQSVVIRPIHMTQMTEKELQAAIKYEAERYLPYSVAEATIKGTILRDSIEGDEKMMEVLLVAAPNEMTRNMQELIKMAQATPEAIDLEPFALLRALQKGIDPETFKQTIALINLGASSSSINIFKGGVLRHNRTITVAGNSFTKAIGQSLNLSFEEAEKIKKDKGVIRVEKDATPVAPTTMRIFNVIIPVLTELVTEIQRSFDYYRARYRGESVDLVVLSGGTAKFKNIDVYIANELSIACQIANPFRNLSIQNVEGMTPEDLEDLAPMAMVVTGLALRSAG
ncbi:MAG TPA: type IV pilus assembly protein PilM [Candidatus Nitrosotenuis sp.]|jgi:type IV pilus assembly protein PilM|nr:type IV pilus assembly protein PilM [Candidatus Nitrosotenuis sp.]